MTVSDWFIMAVFEVAVATCSVIGFRSVSRHRGDRPPSTTAGELGGTLLVAGLAIGLPGIFLARHVPDGRLVSQAALAAMLLGVVLCLSRPFLVYWEQRRAAHAQIALGAVVPLPPLAAGVVAIVDMVVVVVVMLVGAVGVAWLATSEHWSSTTVEVTIKAVAGAILAVGGLAIVGHWWWQTTRIKRAASDQATRNREFLDRPSDPDRDPDSEPE